MILGALVDYYEILAKAGEISKPGYSISKVSYALNLTPAGELIGVLPLKVEVERGKKKIEIAQQLEVPEQEKRAVGIIANFLCDNSSYVLGVDSKGKADRTKLCFEAFKTLHHKVMDGLDTIEAKAVLKFLDEWKPDQYKVCEVISDFREELISGANIIFNVIGIGYVHESSSVRKAWETYKGSTDASVQMQCLATGEMGPVARLHPSIKGVRNAQPMGVSIVSFNERSYESYGRGKQQGLNAPVSEYATFAYATALNHLLADGGNKQFFGDTTVVYWAKSSKRIYQDIFEFALNPVDSEKESADKKTEGLIEEVFRKVVRGEPIDTASDSIDPDTRFYILGLAPNAARLSIRFFMENSFGNILKNIIKHYSNLEIIRGQSEYEYLPLWKLLSETVSPKSKDKSSSPLLSGAVLRSIFSGTLYPEALYNSVILRIRAERDISRGKAAIIKACLIRKQITNYKEELTVSLNEQSENKAYILGRLFAVLEKAQQDANPGITTTIKDRYFTSACATPASVFPILLRLSNHHTAKSNYGHVSERKKSDLIGKLDVSDDPFPAHLNLDEQGIFILGYYHQQKTNFMKKIKEEQ